MRNSRKPNELRHGLTSDVTKGIEVTFALECPEAQEVFLCGDFVAWSPTGLRMIRSRQNGRWEKRLHLPPGRYEYKFVVVGEWIHDPNANQNVPNGIGSVNSVMEVRR